MLDVQDQYVNCKEPVHLMGRWAGAGASVPTPVAKTTRATGPSNPTGSAAGGGPITISRSGVGTLLVTLPNPIGVLQNYAFWCASSANNKNVNIVPPAPGANSFALTITYHANTVAVDLAAGEELMMDVNASLSTSP
jgi:hypothetical protein